MRLDLEVSMLSWRPRVPSASERSFGILEYSINVILNCYGNLGVNASVDFEQYNLFALDLY